MNPMTPVTPVTGVLTSLLATLVSFGLPITDAQQANILTLIATVVPLGLALYTWYNKRKITGRDNPTDYDGTPLVPQDSGRFGIAN